MSTTKKRKLIDKKQTNEKTLRIKLWFHHVKPGDKYGYDSPHFFMFPPKTLEEWELKILTHCYYRFFRKHINKTNRQIYSGRKGTWYFTRKE